jgi:hypothetical protein
MVWISGGPLRFPNSSKAVNIRSRPAPRHREHLEARRIGAYIAIGMAPMARGKAKCASAETQWIARAFGFNKHFAIQYIECFDTNLP